MDKQQQWERKLLDLSLRNNLIHLRSTKNLIPLMVPKLNQLEDALYNGQDFTIHWKPDFVEKNYPSELNFSNLHDLKDLAEKLENPKLLYSPLREKELQNSIVSLYRTARSSLEENGANTLFLALGFLQWYEPKTKDKPRYAPLVLVPIELVRRSAKNGYVIRQREEDLQVNITLLELLKQDFGIQIQGLDPIPQDENGYDLDAIFHIFSQGIENLEDWKVLPSAALGIFSFSQFVMWNDLRNRSKELANNKLVQSLMQGKLAWEGKSMTLPPQIATDHLLLPIPADASQLFAIDSAMEQESFVLHGPPGTGKSQTITAIIANALAKGKTVLFVAEKMAALSVVQKRMEKLGLGEFCLELHSNKSKKREVLDQILKASEVATKGNTEEYAELANQTKKLRGQLDQYAQSLHQVRPSGFSLFEMIQQYEGSKNSPTFTLSDSFVANIQREKYGNILLRIQEFAAMTQALGDINHNPLRFVGGRDYDLSYKLQIPPIAENYKALAESLLPLEERLCQILNHPLSPSEGDFAELIALGQAFEFWQQLPAQWAQIESPALFAIYELSQNALALQEEKRKLSAQWKEDAFTKDANDLLAQWKEMAEKGMISKFFGQNKLQRDILSLAHKEWSKEEIPDYLAPLGEYQQKFNQWTMALQAHVPALGNFYQGNETDWIKINHLSQEARDSLNHMNALPDSFSLKENFVSGENKKLLQEFMELGKELLVQRDKLHQLLVLKDLPSENFLKSQIQLSQALIERTDYLKEWFLWNSKGKELRDQGLQNPEEEALMIPTKEFAAAYQQSVFHQLILRTLMEDSSLKEFSAPSFNEKIQQFLAMDKELQELAKKEVFYRLAARIPDFTKEASQSSELGILQKAIRSGGRGLSIRRLFEQIPNILPRLCPCMLMSPLSAAQYLDPKREPFDLVIFDEASQLPTSKAVGALARGKNAIIVGDPKQMPPTSFFSGENVDEDNLEQEDLESILEDALALSMPQTHLLWHYRSRHESLIAFSNHQFYESRLYTFPSANDQEKKLTFVPSGGTFDRGGSRTNEAEARLVVAEIVRRFHDEKLRKNTVGVVTFNMSQQSLIQDLLEEEYSKNSELDSWANNEEEPLFVKNLENVQGDERDVILFSISFGPDKEGKTYMNFGPLNQEGGWRRLNVAVTRSRTEMMVFSSLSPEDIDLNKTDAQGVAALKAFLAYSKTDNLSQSKGEQDNSPLGVVSIVAQHLEQAGYKTIAMVGQSKFKIDLGVLDPKNENQYLLGILFDGQTYQDALTTRDREIAPLGVLKGLGWNLHRVWSVAFWENPKKEMDKILGKLEALKNGTPLQEEAPFVPLPNSEGSPSPQEETASHQEDATKNCDHLQEQVDPDQKAPDSVLSGPLLTSLQKEVPASTPSPTDHTVATDLPPTRDKKPSPIREEKKDESLPDPLKAEGSDVLMPPPATRQLLEKDIVQEDYQEAKLKGKVLTAKSYCAIGNNVHIVNRIREIVAAEAPISEDYLTKKLYQSFGITRKSIDVQSETIRVLNSMQLKTTLQNGIRYFWKEDQEPDHYWKVRSNNSDNKRDIDQILKKELENALLLVLQEQIAIPRDALLKEASKKLGFARSSDKILLFLEDALSSLELKGYIQVKNEKLQLWDE